MTVPAAGPMTNQVAFEGFIVKIWTHDEDRYVRLANHRPANMGGPIESDYTTVRLDSSVDFNPLAARTGTRVVVRGRIEGRDIPETLKEILSRNRANLQLPGNLGSIVVLRPVTQIYATTLDLVPWHPSTEARSQRPDPRSQRRDDRRQPKAEKPAVKAEATLPPEKKVEPGVDLADVAASAPAQAKDGNPTRVKAVKPAKTPKK